MTYDEWEATQRFSPVSPEASAAEDAWNAAVHEMQRMIQVALETKAESTVEGLVILLVTELEGMET